MSISPPRFVFRQQPEGRPRPFCSVQAGAYLYAAVRKSHLALGVNAAGDVRCRVVGQPGVDNAAQHHVAVAHGIEAVVVRHVLLPVGRAAWYLAPHRSVEMLFLVEVLFPGQFPRTFVRAAAGHGKRRHGCRKDNKQLFHSSSILKFTVSRMLCECAGRAAHNMPLLIPKIGIFAHSRGKRHVKSK